MIESGEKKSAEKSLKQKCLSQSPEKLTELTQLQKSDATNYSSSTGNLNGSLNSSKEGVFFKNNKNDNEMYDSNELNKPRNYYNEEPNLSGIDHEHEYDGLLFMDNKNANNTLHMLNILRKNRQLCDLILQLDDDSQDIYCHQSILACNSKFFMEIFTNYEMEQANTKIEHDSTKDTPTTPHSADKNGNLSTPSDTNARANSNFKRNSFQTIVNTNHNSTHRQLLFCLSDYLRNFLNDNYHHHYAKISSILNHNSHHHHHHNHHSNSSNHHIDSGNTHHNNQNLDYEALKICIDYMYTSQLKVPSYLLPNVYTLAYHLSFDNIVQVCAQYLTKHLNVDNCLSIRSFALDENLIQSSTQCIEKNIDYILQIAPNNHRSSSSSSSTNSLSNSANHTNGDAGFNAATLSSSLNLANKEFNQLPRINIELIGLKPNKCKLPNNITYLTQLCMNWLVEELNEKNENSINDLCNNLNMLYMNSIDQTLHDCCDMDTSDTNFSDYINDYQKQHSLGGSTGGGNSNSSGAVRKLSSRGSPTGAQQNGSCKLKTFKITDQELNAAGTATPIRVKFLHDNEVICTNETGESSFIAICTLTGKLVTLRVHIKQNNLTISSADFSETGEQVSKEATSNNGSETNLRRADVVSPVAFNHSQSNDSESQFSLDQQNNSGQFQNIAHQKSNANSESEKLPKMCVARCSHGVIPYENKLYIVGGYDRGECLDICEIYDPATNKIEKFEQMENRRGRASIIWFEKDKSIYALGGSDGHSDLNSIECFSIEKRKWKSIKFDFELSCTNLGAIACKEFIYLVGLKDNGGKSLSRSTCLRYEPATNAFTRISELNHGRSQSALVWISTPAGSVSEESKLENYFLYVFGGHDQIRCLNLCEVYNVQEDKWTIIPSMHEPRRGCGAAVHRESQLIYIVGGTNGSQSLKSVEIYDIKNKRWTTGPELNSARTNVAIAFIGRFLIFGVFLVDYCCRPFIFF